MKNKYIYCIFDPVTHMGADFISGKPIDKKFKKKIDSWNGEDIEFATYIYIYKGVFLLETNKPDKECYDRALADTKIEYCPKCGRRLTDERFT